MKTLQAYKIESSSWPSSETTKIHKCPARLFGSGKTSESSNDNDNDNDTLREVPHPSNEGLALQARVSGP